MKLTCRIFLLSCLLTAPNVFAQEVCYYLDKAKIKNVFRPLEINHKHGDSIILNELGLVQGKKLKCSWSLNGGSGKRPKFALDGDVAVPILEPECEKPFSHIENGIGFGDWYLTLCGELRENYLVIDTNRAVSVDTLDQWTSFEPGKFPLKGDKD